MQACRGPRIALEELVGSRRLLLLGQLSTSEADRGPGIPPTPQWLTQTREQRTPCLKGTRAKRL